VFFVLLKGLFISRISVWFFSLRFFNASLVSFISLWCLLRSSLSSFICFYAIHVLYFWCLEISWVSLVHSD
jgi:hypothetical protein